MLLSDMSVKRPVFAAVISLLLVAFGIISFTQLPVRELPDIDPPIVSIDTDYNGASAAVVETRITKIIEDRIAGIEGIKSISSSSRDGRSRVTIEFTLDRDIDAAANDVRDRVSRILDNLPDEADPPEISKVDSDTDAIMWYSLSSPVMDVMQLTDYAERNIVDRLSVATGVANVRVGGDQSPAMRIYLDPAAMAARNLTTVDVEQKLLSENVELPAGRIESTERNLTVRVERGYQTAADFANLVLGVGDDGHLIRLGEIARVERAPEDDQRFYRGNGLPRVGLGIIRQSTANTLEVAEAVRAEANRISETLPEGMSLDESFDGSIFIAEAINEVYFTLGIAMVLVVLVLYAFLGSMRTVLVPAVTVPVCIVSAFTVMSILGVSLNLLTLLALVLAIGLVVDDAIVVLENIYRRIEDGEPRLLAAYNGARQVGFAVIATTLVLIGVFVPIAFLEGNVGRLFSELGITLATTVAFSSLVALTLTPMMCSRLLRRTGSKNWATARIDDGFQKGRSAYARALDYCFAHKFIILLMFLSVSASIFGLMRAIPTELAPREDRGAFFIVVRGPEGAGFEYMREQMKEVEDRAMYLVNETKEVRVIIVRADGDNTGFSVVVLEPWANRKRSADEIINELRGRLASMTGVSVFINMRQGISASGGRDPVNFVVGGDTYEDLAQYRTILEEEAAKLPLIGVDTDYRETQPQLRVSIDRNRAADLGVSVAAVGRTLETMLGGRRITTFIERGEEYDVILRADDANRRQPSDLTNIYVRSDTSGELIPLSSVIQIGEQAASATLNRYNRVRALTLTAQLADGYSLDQALSDLEDVVRTNMPDVSSIDYKGESRELKEAGSAVFFTFAMAFLVVFLILAAQFESFIHPFVIMLTVPLAAAGGLLGLYLAGSTLNIYSQIGLVMLIGLAAKNGILIVEFANQMRDEGKEVREAIIEASMIRLRPILMTSISTVMGSVPLIIATGPGSASRLTIGVVIFSGVALSTILTLFMVPVFYDMLAKYTRSPGYEAARLQKQQAERDRKAAGADGGLSGAAGSPAE
ncbi:MULTISPECIES: efflux RND transporter permease subunit [unclassified Iodidimonas]|jgi:multidrug efflux pump|uniref:efflux RND transporter permease subunit n=1 Tax=unclassified Iodidimonas TaxID=2626145 RepID=UPI0024826BB6|nr:MULTISPECIES: efflux RND transporter permease subunit [unclassified Iodidimonas]